MIARRICRWCGKPLPGTSEASRNWYCKPCGRYDAVECLACGTREGFPGPADGRVTMAQAASALRGSGVAVQRKSLVYCWRCFHNAYFVQPAGEDELGCLLCGTTWNRLVAGLHEEEG